MRVFKAAGLLVAVLGLGFSQAHNQSQITAMQQNSAAPIQPPPDAVVLHTEVQEIEDSLSKIPDRGAALFLLARRYAHLGELQKALALLKECIALDEGFDPADTPALQPLKSFPEFRELVEQVHRRYPPVHLARVAFTVPEKDLFPEGLAVDWPKGVFYMGSMHRKKIIRITAAGEISDFVKPGLYGLMPVGGVKVDPADHSVWAATDPDALASVTLIDTGILPGYKWHRLARIWRTPVLGEIFQGTATRSAFRFLVNRDEPRGLPRPFVERMFDHYDRRTKRAVLKLYRATDEPGSPDPELLAALRERGGLPALVIWGGGDAYLPSSYAERQREFFPTAEVNVLPHSGHWPFADAPEDVERLLLAFLARLG